MNRFDFFRGLLWGTALSALMWIGIYKTYHVVVTNTTTVQVDQISTPQTTLVLQENPMELPK